MAFALLGIPAVVTATGYLSLRLAKTIEVTAALALARLSPCPCPTPASAGVSVLRPCVSVWSVVVLASLHKLPRPAFALKPQIALLAHPA